MSSARPLADDRSLGPGPVVETNDAFAFAGSRRCAGSGVVGVAIEEER